MVSEYNPSQILEVFSETKDTNHHNIVRYHCRKPTYEIQHQDRSSQTMQSLVALLKAKTIIQTPRVEQAMLKVDRRHYCPSQYAYHDGPASIGYGATISAPHMHAYALEYLNEKLKEGAKVLDVGSGSGYLTACFAHLVGPTGRVYGVEHIEDLVRISQENIRKDCPELLDSGRVKILRADGRAGLEEHAPFDVIHVGAAAEGLPEQLVRQLKEGARMVIPVERPNKRQVFESLDKLPGGQIKRTDLLDVVYVPLTDAKSQLRSHV